MLSYTRYTLIMKHSPLIRQHVELYIARIIQSLFSTLCNGCRCEISKTIYKRNIASMMFARIMFACSVFACTCIMLVCSMFACRRFACMMFVCSMFDCNVLAL